MQLLAFLKTLEDFVGVEAFAGVEGVGRFRAIFSQRPGETFPTTTVLIDELGEILINMFVVRCQRL